MEEERKGLSFGDGFRFGLGFFTAGLIFYVIVVLITLVLIGIAGWSMFH